MRQSLLTDCDSWVILFNADFLHWCRLEDYQSKDLFLAVDDRKVNTMYMYEDLFCLLAILCVECHFHILMTTET